MQNPRRCLAVVLLLAAMVGCNRASSLGIQGNVTFDGLAIERGKIDFIPIENTPGPSAVSSILNGHYDVPAKWGLLPTGVYQVRITAFRKTGKTEPNRIDHHGPPVPVEDNFIPPIYNSQSTLKVCVADLPDKNTVDFRLGKASRP